MKLAAAVIIAGTLLSIGFCMETSRKETAKQLQELIRFLLFAGQEIEIRGSQVISCTIRKSLSVLLRTSLTERIHIGRNAEKSRIFSLSITTEMAPRDLQSILD